MTASTTMSSVIARDMMTARRRLERWVCVMTRLERLYTYQRQSPWLDNLTRAIPARRHIGGLRGRRDTRGDRQSDDLGEGHRGLRSL